jgi:hypothetical protein
MFSVYTQENVLAAVGPGGNPYPTMEAAESSAKERSTRASLMGLKVRYVAGPAQSKNVEKAAA